jgi:general secretion pathway protein N
MSAVSRRAGGLLILTLGFVSVFMFFLPAELLNRAVTKATEGRISLVAVSGTAWNGSAQIAIFDGQTKMAIPGRLSWLIVWSSVVQRGMPGVTFAHPLMPAPLQITRQEHRWQLSGNQVRFPAAWLTASGTPWNTIKPAGTISLAWSDIFSDEAFTLKMQWQDAQSALSVVKPLGHYQVLATVEKQGNLSANLSTVSGDLNLEGQATWTAIEGFSFKGYATPSPSQQVALTGLLSQMGRQENNRYRLGS